MKNKRLIIHSLIWGVVVSIIWLFVGNLLESPLGGMWAWLWIPIAICLVAPLAIISAVKYDAKNKSAAYFVSLVAFVIASIFFRAVLLTISGGP